MLKLILYCSLDFFKKFHSLYNTVLGQDGLICDCVGWWNAFNKYINIIDDIDIGLCDIVKDIGTNNNVDMKHGVPIGSSVNIYDSKIIR